MTPKDRVARGFNRLSIVVAGVVGLLMLFWLVVSVTLEKPDEPFALTAGFAVACTGLAWFSVRVIGWVVTGFMADEDHEP